MPRRRVVNKRPVLADPVYGSQTLAKFINHMMMAGKRSISEKIVYGAFEVIRNRAKTDPLDVFERALDHVMPAIEVKSRRVGGATYQVPIEVKLDRARTLGMRWIIEYSRKRGDKGGMIYKLAGELMDAADEEGGGTGKGGAVKKREDTHRMAEANKAFSHYRW